MALSSKIQGLNYGAPLLGLAKSIHYQHHFENHNGNKQFPRANSFLEKLISSEKQFNTVGYGVVCWANALQHSQQSHAISANQFPYTTSLLHNLVDAR